MLDLRLAGAEAEEAVGVGEDIEADARQVFAVVGEHGKELVVGVAGSGLPAAGRDPDRRSRLAGGRNDLGGKTQRVGLGRLAGPRGDEREGAFDARAVEGAHEGDRVRGSAGLGGELGEDGLQLAGRLVLDGEGERRLIITSVEGDDAGLGDVGEFLLQFDLRDGATSAGERDLDLLVLDDEELGVGASDRLGGLRGRGKGGVRLGIKRRRGDLGRSDLRRRGRGSGRLRLGFGKEEESEGADDAGHTQEEVLAIHGK